MAIALGISHISTLFFLSNALQENKIGSLPGQSTGLIINNGADLSVTRSSFLGNEEVQVDPRFANYLIGNMNGLLELEGNCFVENQIQFAPVISHSDKFPTVSNNYGQGTLLETCEFVAVFRNTGTAAAVSQSNYYCIEFDRLSCVRSPGQVATRDPDHGDPIGFEFESKAATTVSGMCSLVLMYTTLAILDGIALW